MGRRLSSGAQGRDGRRNCHGQSGIACYIRSTCHDETQPLIGRWRLLSFTERRPDGTVFDVFGADPIDHIIYLESGYMLVLFARADRPRFSGGRRRCRT
ncbi:MAG: hypothetical protein EXR39_19025 [Betaproteobacteria bacterium]|nr:hypothetical protein [Betaproteobacteria bacterium]